MSDGRGKGAGGRAFTAILLSESPQIFLVQDNGVTAEQCQASKHSNDCGLNSTAPSMRTRTQVLV